MSDADERKSKSIFQGRIVNLQIEDHILPDGREASFEIIHHPGGAAALPLLDDGRVVLIRQFRPALQQIIIELPAGKLESGEAPETCIRRELEEEIGYRCGRLAPLGRMWPAVGFCDELIHLFLAHDLEHVTASPEADEFIEPLILPFSTVLKMVADGEITDGKTQLAVLLYAQLLEGEKVKA